MFIWDSGLARFLNQDLGKWAGKLANRDQKAGWILAVRMASSCIRPTTDIFHIISIPFNCRDTSLRVAEAMICFFEFGARTRPQDLMLFLISETELKLSFLAWTQGEISIGKRAHMERSLYSSRLHGNIYSGTPPYRQPFSTDSFGCPYEKVIFSLKSTLLVLKR